MQSGKTEDPSGTELVMLGMITANFTAVAAILETLSRFHLLDEREIPILHDKMSSAIDAVGPDAPLELAATAQAMMDMAFSRLLDRTRSRTL